MAKPNEYIATLQGSAGSGDSRTCMFASMIDQTQGLTEKVSRMTAQLRLALDMINGPYDHPVVDEHISKVAPIKPTIGLTWDQLCEAVSDLERQIDRLY